MAQDVAARLPTLFPTAQDIPAAAECAPGGSWKDANTYLVDGEVLSWTGPQQDVQSPICIREADGSLKRRVLGKAAQLSTEEAMRAVDAASRAWDRGRGAWPTMKVAERIERVEEFSKRMAAVREESVRLLMWEIGKTRADSEKEFDRTLTYIQDTVDALKQAERDSARFSRQSGIVAQIRRAPLGVTLCMGPFNYPLNETYTTLLPALIMGNPVVAKLPRFGALCQLPLLKAFAECFPRGVVNVINGEGKNVAGPLMESGKVAVLAFIGSSRVANLLKKQHPTPNRLRCILGLDAKNPAIILDDADIDLAVQECLMGSLSFNGQRCTALKILHVQRRVADKFIAAFAAAVDELPFGMPWEKGVRLTPLPELDKPAHIQRMVDDAVTKGAKLANKNGGKTVGTFYFPSVLANVTPEMTLYTQEQFGPAVPICIFDDVRDVEDAVASSNYGQQVSIFGRNARTVGRLTDFMVNQVSRVNINAQCQRGPDVYPFTGRKDSAEGTLSVGDALRSFSIRAMVATPDAVGNHEILRDVLTMHTSNFINTDYLF